MQTLITYDYGPYDYGVGVIQVQKFARSQFADPREIFPEPRIASSYQMIKPQTSRHAPMKTF
jgi:hypothetical protein